MKPLTQKKQFVYDICILISIIAAIVITYVSISHEIYDVFPYFYIIPIVLIAFTHPRMSIYGTVLIGWLYFALVFLIGLPDMRLYLVATVWFYIFVSLGILISTYSQYYRKEGERSCGSYFNSQAGVFIFNRRSLKITEANRKFANMIRFECEDLLGKTLTDIITNTEERITFLTKVQDMRRVVDIEVRFQGKDGTLHWALVSAADCGEPSIICTVVDVTDLKQTQEALTQANRKLNLLNNVTRHDILNQLTALLGYLQLSRDDVTDPQLAKFIEKEQQAADAIRSQILFTRDYQNIGVHSPKWQNVAEIISLAIATLDLVHIKFSINLAPVEIYADPLLEKVFYNLIENSVRHGEIVTEISINSSENENGLELTVEDNGIGIPQDTKDKIFRRQYFKNTGFGLFLSREILAITGLTISENGIPKKGARFVIHVPKGAYRQP
jgi:PAS domain S-box-containing protein